MFAFDCCAQDYLLSQRDEETAMTAYHEKISRVVMTAIVADSVFRARYSTQLKRLVSAAEPLVPRHELSNRKFLEYSGACG